MAHYNDDDDYDLDTPVEEVARRILWAIGIFAVFAVAWLFFG